MFGFGFDLFSLFFEDIDEGVADKLPLLLRVCDALETVEEPLRGIDDSQVDTEVLSESFAHGFGFVQAQAAVVHEDGVESVTNGLLHQLSGANYLLVIICGGHR